jgi:outer membrane receptor protein involved in Fe transport
MKSTRDNFVQNHGGPRVRSRVGKLLLGSTALAAALLATTAFAQDNAPAGTDNPEAAAQDDSQVVVVTGISRSL